MSLQWLAEFGDIETPLRHCGTCEWNWKEQDRFPALDPDESYQGFANWQEYENFMLGLFYED